MDARLRSLFSRRRSRKHEQLRLKAHPYESTVKEKSPTKGTRPIAGNGPYRLENVALQSQKLGTEPPNVPRSRRDSYSSRPRTAPQSAQFELYRRRKSALSTKVPSTSSGPAREPPPTNPSHLPSSTRKVKSVDAFSSHLSRPRSQSTHVDLLDAVAWINPSAQTLMRKRIASGKRDYGEDVADRNIEAFGGDEFPQHDAYSYYTDDAAHSLDESRQETESQDRPDSRKSVDSRDGSTKGLASHLESDGTGNDRAHLNNPTHTSVYQNLEDSTVHTAASSHPRDETSNTDCNNSTGLWGNGRTSRPSSASTQPKSSVILDAWPSDIGSASLNYTGGDLAHAANTSDSARGAANSTQPVLRTKESRGTQTTPPPPEPAAVPPIILTTAGSLLDADNSYSDSDSYDPPPILRPRLSRRTILPTPPISPTRGGSPTSSTPRVSLEKEQALPPSSTQTSPSSKRYSRAGFANHSMFPRQDPESGSKVSGHASSTIGVEEASSGVRPDGDRISGDRSLEVPLGPPRLEDTVDAEDTRNIIETEVPRKQLSGAVPEYITPKVHHIRGILHQEDVFERIQPISDVEVSPTKYDITAANNNVFIETPESKLPGHQITWVLQSPDKKVTAHGSALPGPDIKIITEDPESFIGRDPLVQDIQKSMVDNEIVREETLWRHPSQLGNGGQEKRQAVPPNIDHYDDDDTDDCYDTASEHYANSDPYAGSEKSFSTNADGEEELLFRDSDLAFDGHLPGLEDLNPVIDGNLTASRPSTAVTRKADDVGEGEATNTPSRLRAADWAMKIGLLSVTEK